MNVTAPKYEIFYNGSNITGNILPYALSFTYTDKAQGESDELELVLQDKDFLWRLEWYPVKGDTITARIFDKGRTLECGKFTIDEISMSGSDSGDIISIRALAAGINNKVRTKRSTAHENKTLREIANTIAKEHGLTVQGEIDNVRIARFSSFRETDLHALKRLANDYGYTFSVRDTALIFTSIFKLEDKNAALSIKRGEMKSFSITDKTAQTFKAVNLVYHNPKQKKVIKQEHTESREAFKSAKTDTLELRIKAENQQQADIKAKVALYRANSLQQEGTVEIPGNIYALAGNNVELVDLGACSGKYYITSSTHSVSKDSGYTTGIEIKRVGLVDRNKQKLNDEIGN